MFYFGGLMAKSSAAISGVTGPGSSKPATWTVLGNPVPKGRPRLFRRGRFVQAVTPKRTREYEARIHASTRSLTFQHDLPLPGSVEVELRFYMGTKRRADLDNLVKSVLDGLNGVAYNDDAQVVKIVAFKLYDKKNPRVEVTINATV